MNTGQRKILFVIAKKNFSDKEYEDTREILEGHGFHITVASDMRGTCYGREESMVQAELALSEVSAHNYEAVIFIGGMGASQYFHDGDALNLVQDAIADGVLAAICIAPTILANAGVLKGKKVTAFPSEKEALEKAGAIFTGADVEQDGYIITANGPDSAKRFAETIASVIA